MSNNVTRKSVTQELKTVDNVSDVAVWDSGSQELKRITKTAFDADVSSQPTLTTDTLAPRTPEGTITSTAPIKSTGKISTTSPTGGIGYDTGAGGVVTQITSINTTVELNTVSGTITTVSSTLAKGLYVDFKINNSNIAATDTVVVNLATYGGTGYPIVTLSRVEAGFFKVTIQNVHATDPLNAVLVINFTVVKGVSA